ncbi:MAG: Vitamin B12 dependent methionine synthase activation subunit [Oscillospiraceae bacterium]|nr:Vitamin B12 dependent methionine synthase activation subunit [Oscillospiraceae bacterium]
MLLKFNEKEVLRYLGYRGVPADERTVSVIDEVYQELLKVVQPKYIYREYDFDRSDGGITVENIEFKSEKLLSHLKNSSSVVLFGATLGTETDTLIRRYSVSDTAHAAVAQAVAASLTENLCDRACEEIKQILGGTHRPRFSPGYGDLELSTQRDFFKLLDMSRRLGVTLSDECIMTPTKSVTAFIGIIK